MNRFPITAEPTQIHPLTPKANHELTTEIGTYHAKALDKSGGNLNFGQ
ncbi:MAG: hypothetical protein AAGB24_08150 [Bacteroidota bacterium]